MRIAVIGTGGLGGYYGGQLTRAGFDVTFLARGAALEAIRERGLVVRSALSGDYTVQPAVTNDVAGLGTPDLILFTTKAYDLDQAAMDIAPAVGPQTTLLAVQNGISHIDRLSAAISRERILPGVIFISSSVAEPGVIEQTGGPGRVVLGEEDGTVSARVERIADAFSTAGVAVETSSRIWARLWHKFMFICAMSGVSALTRLTLREIFDVPESRDLYLAVMEEVASVARASGVDLPQSAASDALENLERMPMLPLRGSMAVDLMAGRRMELDVLNGTVVEYGRRLGVDVPMNLAIYRALKPYAAGR
jgi:2-dehydropantoate 2-reductase